MAGVAYDNENKNQATGIVTIPKYSTFAQKRDASRLGLRSSIAYPADQSAVAKDNRVNAFVAGVRAKRVIWRPRRRARPPVSSRKIIR